MATKCGALVTGQDECDVTEGPGGKKSRAATRPALSPARREPGQLLIRRGRRARRTHAGLQAEQHEVRTHAAVHLAAGRRAGRARAPQLWVQQQPLKGRTQFRRSPGWPGCVVVGQAAAQRPVVAQPGVVYRTTPHPPGRAPVIVAAPIGVLSPGARGSGGAPADNKGRAGVWGPCRPQNGQLGGLLLRGGGAGAARGAEGGGSHQYGA